MTRRRNSRRAPRAGRRLRRLRLEALETRRLLAVFTVTTAEDVVDEGDSLTSLREAIATANALAGPDTIAFDPQTFGSAREIDLRHGQLDITDSLTIRGPQQHPLRIDAQSSSRVIGFFSSLGDLTLEHLTLTGGRTTQDDLNSSESGGAIRFASAGTLTLNHMSVAENGTIGSGARGGGIFAQPGTVVLNQSTVSGNSTAGENASGGGIYAGTGAVSIVDSTVSGNTTAETRAKGGGIYSDAGGVSLVRSFVVDNATVGTSADGGGIFFRDGTLSITASNIQSNNTLGATSLGGGIAASFATIGIANTAIVSNGTAGDSSDGAGVSINGSTLKIVNATLSGNTASGSSSSGGGIDSRNSSDVSIVNTTITENSVSGDRGGINVAGGPNEVLSIVNSIVAGNTDSGTAPDLLPPSNPTNLTLLFSLIGDNTGTMLSEAQTADAMGNLIGSASGAGIIDPMLAALAINGGTTPTHAPLPASSVIDAGDDALAVDLASNPLTSDQRQAPFLRRFGNVDIGSFETQPAREPIIHWSDPANLFEGTELSELQLNATTDAAGVFVYSPDIGTTLDLGDGQVLMVQFTPSDTINYSQTSATVSINVVERSDLGDAPDSYATLRSSDGPRHLVGSLMLGAAVDAEVDGQPSADAVADGDDDDGVTLISSLVADALSSTTASMMVNASASSKLDAWIDFDGNGVFDHPSEHIGGGASINLAAGNNIVAVSVPAGATPGDTFARVRISSSGGLLPTGAAADGEVEDYAVTILDGSTAPTVDLRLPRGPVTLFSNAGDLVVQLRTEDLFRAAGSAVGRYEIIGDEFSNVLTIDTTGGSAIPLGGLFYDGVDRVNTVRLVGANNSLDLSRDGNASFRNIDVIDISDFSASTLSLDARAARAMDPTGGGVIVVGSQGDSIVFIDGNEWRMAQPVNVAGFSFSVVTLGDAFVQVDFVSPWQNLAQPSDVNNDGNVTAGDALRIINELARRAFSDPNTAQLDDPATVSAWPDVYFDQSGDGFATALDALRVINQLAREANNGGSGEGESARASGGISAGQNVVSSIPISSIQTRRHVEMVAVSGPGPVLANRQGGYVARTGPGLQLLSPSAAKSDMDAVDQLLSDASYVESLSPLVSRL